MVFTCDGCEGVYGVFGSLANDFELYVSVFATPEVEEWSVDGVASALSGNDVSVDEEITAFCTEYGAAGECRWGSFSWADDFKSGTCVDGGAVNESRLACSLLARSTIRVGAKSVFDETLSVAWRYHKTAVAVFVDRLESEVEGIALGLLEDFVGGAIDSFGVAVEENSVAGTLNVEAVTEGPADDAATF